MTTTCNCIGQVTGQRLTRISARPYASLAHSNHSDIEKVNQVELKSLLGYTIDNWLKGTMRV
jgi:hypothetical protein